MFKVTIPSSMTSDSLKSIDNMSEQLMLLSVSSLDSNKVALVAASAYLVNACAAAGNLNE